MLRKHGPGSDNRVPHIPSPYVFGIFRGAIMFLQENKPALALLLAIMMIVTLTATTCSAEVKNYCHDPEAEAQWIALLEKNPKDYDLQALHALRIGICVKVDQGVLTLEEGTEIFERARAALLGKREEEKKQEGSQSKQHL
jgi:hypothetical protein